MLLIDNHIIISIDFPIEKTPQVHNNQSIIHKFALVAKSLIALINVIEYCCA